MDLIANSIVYTPARARQLVQSYMDAAGGCGCGPNGCGPAPTGLDDFLVRALAEKITGADVFRVTLTAFLDVHNFDTRRVMKCCLAHLLPSGHIVPFCAYNTLYRDGHVPLPPLADEVAKVTPRRVYTIAAQVSPHHGQFHAGPFFGAGDWVVDSPDCWRAFHSR